MAEKTGDVTALEQTEEKRGEVLREIYYSGENGYSIVSFKERKKEKGKDRSSEEYTMKGIFPRRPKPGMRIVTRGKWEKHKTYGEQFSADFICEDVPDSLVDLTYYLEHGLAPGISEELGKSICRKFGKELPNIMFGDIDRLKEVRGIKEKRLKKIKKLWKEQEGKYDAMIFLRSHGITQKKADRIWDMYKSRAIDIILENPYRLASDVNGIGFRIADELALNMGYDRDGSDRIRAGIIYVMQTASEIQGDVFLFRKELISRTKKLLGTERDLIASSIDSMAGDRLLIRDTSDPSAGGDEDRLYLPQLYWAEKNVARALLKHCAMRYSQRRSISVAEIEHALGLEYNEDQRAAIEAAGTTGALILTGGPGTGKTTTMNGIIRKSCLQGKGNILLAAPTGRAAKRMSEAAGGWEAKTIHRLLEFNPETGFKKNESDPISGDLLLIDEASMIDIWLMNCLLKAVPDDMPVVFIGDVDQLPSVGPGRVFGDMIRSGVLRTARLEKIYRQAEKSAIIKNAHRIIRGNELVIDNSSDFLFKTEEDPAVLEDTVVRFFTESIPSHYGIDIDDIQILCPSKIGTCGTVALNKKIQEKLHSGEPCICHGDYSYAVGDRVMQVKNNYDDGIFNGDIGTVVEIDKETGEVVVSYDEKEVTYSGRKMDSLILSYAVTVHKSQGSEFDYVIFPMCSSVYMGLLQRNLFYTGVTRAKKRLVLLGSRNAVTRSIKNAFVEKRNTTLCERLLEKE